jgi:arylsulfatase A-like enzyme
MTNKIEDYNIILVNLDGLRNDKVQLSPTLEKLKENSYNFSEINTVATYTFASLHALFSGNYPSKNGVNAYYNIFNFKSNETTTMAEILKSSGYYTCCDIISKSVSPKQGYDEYNLFDEEKINFSERHKKLIQKLSKKEKFFLFLHYTETHKNLVREIVKKYQQDSIEDDFHKSQNENQERYNSYMPSCENYVSTILNTIKETGIDEKTIVIFFSDHGTSIGEKIGEKFYGVFLYDYTLKVFCIMHIPNHVPKVLDNVCSTIDIFPTILEIAGIKENQIKQKIQGKSLFEFIDDPNTPSRDIFAETGGLYGPWPSPKKHNVFCIKSNNRKLIYNDTPKLWEFYDLNTDPDELNNIYDPNLIQIKSMKSKLHDFFTENKIPIKLD